MTGIAIYVEGGGTPDQRSELRLAFDRLLRSQKHAALRKGLQWKLVPCGSRDETRSKFRHELDSDAGLKCLLLVDSEGPVQRKPLDHLRQRDPAWDLKGVEEETVHLMVQCMEAWIAADPDAMSQYYGKGFRAQDLPKRLNLEEEPKLDISDKLERATKSCKKGGYSKGGHSAKLLATIDAQKVGKRCPHFARFVNWLDAQIDSA